MADGADDRDPSTACTVALIALVGTRLGQILIASRSRPVVATVFGALAAMAVFVGTPGVGTLVGCVPVGPVGWAQGLGAAAGATVLAEHEAVDRFRCARTAKSSQV